MGILLKLSRVSLKQDSTPDPAPWSCKTMKTHIDRFDIHWRIQEIRGPAPLTAGFEASKLSNFGPSLTILYFFNALTYSACHLLHILLFFIMLKTNVKGQQKGNITSGSSIFCKQKPRGCAPGGNGSDPINDAN